MGKTIIWTYQADAELNEAFLELLEQTESIETTVRIIQRFMNLLQCWRQIQRFIN